jgi:hypothetical protein
MPTQHSASVVQASAGGTHGSSHPTEAAAQMPGPPATSLVAQQTAVESPHGFAMPVVHEQPMNGREGSSQ